MFISLGWLRLWLRLRPFANRASGSDLSRLRQRNWANGPGSEILLCTYIIQMFQECNLWEATLARQEIFQYTEVVQLVIGQSLTLLNIHNARRTFYTFLVDKPLVWSIYADVCVHIHIHIDGIKNQLIGVGVLSELRSHVCATCIHTYIRTYILII